MKKRILIFSTAYLPLIGGAEVAVKEITDRLGFCPPAGGFDFVLVTARLDRTLPSVEKIGQGGLHRVGVGNNFDKFRLIIDGPAYAEKLGEFDAVWSIMASYAGFAALRYKKEHPQTPYLLTLQEGDSRWQIYKHVWWCWWYFKDIFKRADRIQAISNYLAKWGKELGAGGSVEVVPNGVSVEKFQVPNTKFQINSNIQNDLKKELKNKLGISIDSKLIITTSRLVAKNGVGDLIGSLAFLPTNVHLLIAGTGELHGQLMGLVKELRLGERVHWLGNVSQADLPGYLWGSEVFCRPSLSEGLGIAFLEAMAAGGPVVATRVGGIPDFLINGQTGWFCEVRNPKSIAEVIGNILDEKNGESVNRVTANALTLIQEKYTWDKVAGQIKTIFDTLCAS